MKYNFKNISRRKRNYQLKKQQLLKSEKSINRFSLSIIKKLVKDLFIEISKELLTPLIKDAINDLFGLSNDSPIIDFAFSSIKPTKFIFWLIEFLKSLMFN